MVPLYSSKCEKPFIFKGGTSLSKGYNLINRMSEDIDLSFSLELLDSEPIIPHEQESRKSLNRRAIEIDEKAEIFIKNLFIQDLDTKLSKLDSRITISIESEKPLNIAIYYPKSLDEDEYGSSVQSRVLLETGGRSENDPLEEVKINHMLGNTIKVLKDDEFSVTMLSPARTLFEKAFGIHTNNIKQNVPDKHARHLYDIIQIYNYKPEWCQNNELLERVITFSENYYKWHKESCDSAKKGNLIIVPRNEVMIKKYKDDWDKMEDMFYGSQFPYTFDELLEKLEVVETQINS